MALRYEQLRMSEKYPTMMTHKDSKSGNHTYQNNQKTTNNYNNIKNEIYNNTSFYAMNIRTDLHIICKQPEDFST